MGYNKNSGLNLISWSGTGYCYTFSFYSLCDTHTWEKKFKDSLLQDVYLRWYWIVFWYRGLSLFVRNIPLMKHIRKIKCALLNRILSWKIDGHLLMIIIIVIVENCSMCTKTWSMYNKGKLVSSFLFLLSYNIYQYCKLQNICLKVDVKLSASYWTCILWLILSSLIAVHLVRMHNLMA